MATLFERRKVVPGLGAMSEPFQSGYEQASKDEPIGWKIEHAPNERTIVACLLLFSDVVSSELAHGRDCEYSVHWMSGLITGWLRREQ